MNISAGRENVLNSKLSQRRQIFCLLFAIATLKIWEDCYRNVMRLKNCVHGKLTRYQRDRAVSVLHCVLYCGASNIGVMVDSVQYNGRVV